MTEDDDEFEWQVRCLLCGRPYTPGRECRVGGDCEPDRGGDDV